MSKSLLFVFAAAGLLAYSHVASAQDPSFRADRKITGQYFRPHTAGAYHYGAIGHSEALGYYGRRYSEVPKETTQVHVDEIHRNLTAAQKEFDKFGKEAKGNKELEAHLKKIQEHQAKAAELVKKLQAGATDSKTLTEYSAAIAKELKAAEAENDLLKKTLGVHKDAKPANAKPAK